MVRLNQKTLISILSFMLIVLTSCDDSGTSNETPDPVVPDPVSNLQATSDHRSILVKWDASPSETNDLFKEYLVTIMPGDITYSFNESNVSHKLGGLVGGKVYTIKVKTIYTNNEESTETLVQWSPATREFFDDNLSDIKLHEYQSQLGSGLDFHYTDDGYTSPKICNTTEWELWDLGLNTADGKFVIASPTLIGWQSLEGKDMKSVEIAEQVILAESLDEVFHSKALDQTYSFDTREIDLNAYNSSIVIICRVMEPGETEFTYVKLLIKYVDGSFFQGEAPDRYVEVEEISYQDKPGVPYA